MIELRNAAEWAGVPIEFVADLPPGAYEELWEAIAARDKWVVRDRK